MDRKGHLLSHLKKQVISLRNQLERITQHTQPALPPSSLHNHSQSQHRHSHSPRFDSSSFDSTYLERGIRKFPLADSKFRNIAQIIDAKSKPEHRPKLSSQRKAELQRTKENFSTEMFESIKERPRSPNPLTGEGHKWRAEGRMAVVLTSSARKERSSERRHFHTYDQF